MNLIKQTGRLWCSTVGVAILGYSLSACQPAQVEVEVHLVSMQQIQPRYGAYGEAAWLPDDQLGVEYDRFPQDSGRDSNLWIMRIDGSEFQKLDLPTDPRHECLVNFFSNPVTLPNGHVALVRECLTLGLVKK